MQTKSPETDIFRWLANTVGISADWYNAEHWPMLNSICYSNGSEVLQWIANSHSRIQAKRSRSASTTISGRSLGAQVDDADGSLKQIQHNRLQQAFLGSI